MFRELVFLRAFCCFAIVLVHATTNLYYESGKFPDSNLYMSIRTWLTAATAIFIILSFILVARKPAEQIKIDFLVKRFKYIFMPYISFALIYWFVMSSTGKASCEGLACARDYVLEGRFVGWFVLVIMQLYILYYILKKLKISNNVAGPFFMIIGALPLRYANYEYHRFTEDSHYVKITVFVWLFYFGLGLFIGEHYKWIREKAKEYKYLILLAFIVSLLNSYINYHYHGITMIGSRRPDLVFIVISGILLVVGFFKDRKPPMPIQMLNDYSFAIFLTHWLLQLAVIDLIGDWGNLYFQLCMNTIPVIVLGVVVVKLISYLPYSQFIIGSQFLVKKKREERERTKEEQDKVSVAQ